MNYNRPKAIEQAKANASRFGVPYIVFLGSDLRWRTERFTTQDIETALYVTPDGNVSSDKPTETLA